MLEKMIIYLIGLILRFENESKDTPSQTVHHILDTKEERKSFFQKVLVFIMETLLGMLTDKETKTKINKMNAEKLMP